MQLAWNMEGTDVAARFNAMGISAVVLKYRVPQRPAQPTVKGRDTFGWAPLQDAQRAMGIVRERQSPPPLDLNRRQPCHGALVLRGVVLPTWLPIDAMPAMYPVPLHAWFTSN